MPRIGTLQQARTRSVRKPIRAPEGLADSHVTRSDIIAEERDSRDPDTPNAKLIEQEPGSVLRSHYHRVDQFQIVVAGSGRIGKHEVTPGAVHFASAYTGYGPIAAGEQGLSYLVFRLGCDGGAAWLPDQREQMKAGPRQYLISNALCQAGDPQLRSEHAAFDEQANGVQATAIVMPANDSVTLAAFERGAFVQVLEGSVQCEDLTLDAGATLALAPHEAATLRAPAGGARLLWLLFPRGALGGR